MTCRDETSETSYQKKKAKKENEKNGDLIMCMRYENQKLYQKEDRVKNRVALF